MLKHTVCCVTTNRIRPGSRRRLKMSIFTPKISDDTFFSHRPYFSGFACLYFPFLNLYFLKKLLYDTFFTHFVLSHESDNNTSQNIWGRMHGPSRTSNVGGTVPPFPLSLRPWG